MNQMDVALDPSAGCGANYLRPAIFAVDPGPENSGWCVYDPVSKSLQESGVDRNPDVLRRVATSGHYQFAFEMIASYGMPVGREVFETCLWIGRFVQAAAHPGDVRLIYRKDVKMHLCGSIKAKDANVRQALLDMFPGTGGGKTPQIGTKKQPGPLYGVSTHAWPALGVAVTLAAQTKGK